ncbi:MULTISPECIES: hypothetical protein [Microbacterium]|uniref:hypothetical protein n=1 Tax=Microbacterium TaxID=33882 RepID=UPI00217D14F9|nr:MULTISPECIES: hypothetical protein [Microbacterium]UWF77483.1 hypothetical protein JSY13_12155 [Microbacterium neungamense]WCM55646.1 hypothetical protein JRG78_12165 [Microbacterium sp. EF45047]
MTDGLDIVSGGAIAVDTEALRDVGRRLHGVARMLTDAESAIRRACGIAGGIAALRTCEGDLAAGAGRIARLADECAEDAAGTLLMADVFEVVELQARQRALEVNDPRAALALQDRIDRLTSADPRIGSMAAQLVAGWEERRFQGLEHQHLDRLLVPGSMPWSGPGPIGGLALAGGGIAAVRGLGVLPYGARLDGTAPPVRVERVATWFQVPPPRNIAESLQRIPRRGAQVRVEEYTMRDGARRFVAYIDGTRTALPLVTQQPWDMGSNWDAYMRQEKSAAYHAVQEALREAGAGPDSRVDLVGYSQGAMIASYLAMDGSLDVGTTVLAGSPVEPSLQDGQTLVQLRHSDDPIAALAGGGSPGSPGADGFTAWREAGDGMFGNDAPFAAHDLEAYIETAGMVDASRDPRVEEVTLWSELAGAVDVRAFDYVATRPAG